MCSDYRGTKKQNIVKKSYCWFSKASQKSCVTLGHHKNKKSKNFLIRECLKFLAGRWFKCKIILLSYRSYKNSPHGPVVPLLQRWTGGRAWWRSPSLTWNTAWPTATCGRARTSSSTSRTSASTEPGSGEKQVELDGFGPRREDCTRHPLIWGVRFPSDMEWGVFTLYVDLAKIVLSIIAPILNQETLKF